MQDAAPAMSVQEETVSPEGQDINLHWTGQLYRALEPGRQQIGDLPPAPPTLRGRMGAALVKVVQRMLFWYTDQIRTFQTNVSEAAREHERSFLQLGGEQRRHRKLLADVSAHCAAIESQVKENHARVLESVKRLTDQMNGLTDQIQDFGSEVSVNERHIQGALARSLAEIALRKEDLLYRQSVMDRFAQFDRALTTFTQAQTELAEQERQRGEALGWRLSQIEEALAVQSSWRGRGGNAK
jgi:vacuolar-type H+-ATPase subunit I/STV1